MVKNNAKGCLILAAAAFIWGTAFIAQSVGMDYVEPFTFTFCRSLLGAAVLFPVSLIAGKKPMGRCLGFDDPKLLKAGILSGLFLFGGIGLQQVGIQYTTSGKAAFITALYIIFAPVAALLVFRKRPGVNVWASIAVGAAGMYLLCMNGDLSMGKGDGIVFLGSLFFTAQILVIDHYSSQVDCVRMSFLQFLVCAVLSLFPMFLFETPKLAAIGDCALPILYAGVMSSAVAYTLQIIGQKYADVTLATLTMSLESVFAALAGWIILKEKMTLTEIIGCVLIFAAILAAQLPMGKRKKDIF